MKKILLILLTLFLLTGCGKYTGEKAQIDLYAMSQCPYGVEAENTFIKIAEDMEDSVNLNIEFIGAELGYRNFQSLHGESEIQGDTIQLCTKEYHPQKYLQLINCMNKKENFPDNWEECSNELELDTETLKTCLTSDEGKDLFSNSIRKAGELQIMGSPTIYINNQQYQGNRDPKAILRAICQSFGPIKPSECKSIPEPTRVELKIITSNNCEDCETSQITSNIKQIIPGITITEIEESSEEGKKLIEKLEIQLLPAYLFDEKLEDTEIWTSNEQVRTLFEEKEDYYKIIDQATSATYFINPIKRAEYEAMLEQQKQEKIKLLNLGDKPQIDFFVMSYCPYGNQAEEIIAEVFKTLKSSVEFVPHYIFYENYNNGGPQFCIDEENKYCSMHGVQEANQDIRELCVYKQYGIAKYFDFVKKANEMCDYTNVDECWDKAALKIGIDKYRIRTCEKTEVNKIAEKQLQTTKTLQVSGSPTIFINGEIFEGQRSAEAFKQALCELFKDKPEECNTEIINEVTTQAVQGQC